MLGGLGEDFGGRGGVSGRVGVLGAARERRAHAWGERGVGKGLRGGTTRGHGQGGCVGGHSADPQADTPGWPPGKVARPFLQARWQRQSSAGSRGWRGSGEATTSEPPGGGGGGVCVGGTGYFGEPPRAPGPSLLPRAAGEEGTVWLSYYFVPGEK